MRKFIKLRRVSIPTAAAVLITMLSAALAWWVSAPVMRESDQASLLVGALELSRGFSPLGQEFYNYDKQWFSYWVVAFARQCIGGGGEVSLSSFVVNSNRVALMVGWIGVSLAVLTASRGGWRPLLLCAGLLLAPVWLLSIPLLSSNIISAGFVGFWIVAMEWGRVTRKKNLSWICVGGFSFLAVGARVDAALMLPALSIAWWGIGRSWNGLLGCGLLWASFLGATLAFILGGWMSDYESANYLAFFKWQTFTAYFVFGLGGLVFWYVGIFTKLFQRRKTQNWMERVREWVWFVCLLFPIIYYGRVLYSPRHLLTAAMVVCLSGCFSASWEWWRVMYRGFGKWLFILGYLSLLAPMIFGVQLKSLSKGTVVLTEDVTKYPTADGHWPMGGYFGFLQEMKNADQSPIDHNQRIWGAWLEVNENEVPNGPITVISSGLSSYGELWTIWHNRDINAYENLEFSGGVLMIDDRTLLRGKKRFSVQGLEQRANVRGWELFQTFNEANLMGFFRGGRILRLSGNGSMEGNHFLEIAEIFRKLGKGDAFVVTKLSELLPDIETVLQRRWALIFQNESGLDYKIWSGSFNSSDLNQNQMDKGWVGWSELPAYFKVSQY